MKTKSLLLLGFAIAAFSSSCKKNDDPAPPASSLAAGTSAISFNTNVPYNGKTAHSYTHSIPAYVSQCKRQASGGMEVLMLDGGGTSNLTNVTTNMIRFYVPAGANTTSGTIRQSVTLKGEPTEPIMSFAEVGVSGTAAVNDAFVLSEGTVEITKLSATEIEGTFSGKGINEDANKTYEITNGKFSGKF